MLVRERIAAERKRQGMSAADLSQAVGVNKGTVSRYENGYIKEIPVDILHRLADALNIEFDELVRDDPRYRVYSKDYMKSRTETISSSLTTDEEELVMWYRGLPREVKEIVRQIRSLNMSRLA